MERRPTIRDIAARVGFHFTTVSLALRDHPSIPERTRQKIKRVAEEMQYRPDPVLSALMAYRKATRRSTPQAALAWATFGDTRDAWQEDGLTRDVFESAQVRARDLGYALEPVWCREPGVDNQRLQGILDARGIQGVLLSPGGPEALENDFDASPYAFVGLGERAAQGLNCHRVSSDVSQTMAHLLTLLRERGYIRAGLVVVSDDLRDHDAELMARYWVEHQRDSESEYVPYLHLRTWDPDAFRAWFEEHLPCAVISESFASLEALRTVYDIPADLAFVTPCASRECPTISGHYSNGGELGRTATDLLVGLLHRHEMGLPEHPRRILIPGYWNEGKTILEENPRVMLRRLRRRHALPN